jgi:hypothetical protein
VKKLFLFFAAAIIFLVSPAFSVAQTTINFDDITDIGAGTPIPNGYQGFNWNNFYVLNTLLYPNTPNGYQNDLISSPNVALNGFANPASITSSTPFTLNSGYFGAGWNDGLLVTVTGTIQGGGTDSITFSVNTSSPTLITFNWSNIISLNFSSAGGTLNLDLDGSGEQFALDNLVVNGPLVAPTPEPSTLILFFLGGAALFLLTFLRGR